MDVDLLNQCRYLAREIKQLETLRASLLGSSGRAMDGMPHGGKLSDPVSNSMLQRQRLQGMIDDKRIELIGCVVEIEDFIQCLGDSVDRQIMREYYFNGLDFDAVGDKVGYSERQVRRRRDRIIEDVLQCH